MQALKLPSRYGWNWLTEGYVLFRRNPALLSLLVWAYWLCPMLLGSFPYIGVVLAALVMPGLSVGVISACRNLDQGYPATPANLFSGFRDNPRTLIALGGFYLVCLLGILAFCSLLDDGLLLSLMLGKREMDEEVLSSGALMLSSQTTMLLLTPVMMANWYAPPLAAWHRLPLFKSLFFSLVACWRNWRVFLTYLLGVLLMALLVPMLVVTIFAAALPQSVGLITLLLMVPLTLVLAPTLFASTYISYRDVFVASRDD
ncbi:MAG: hypothetical protein RIR00_960 [Pseudomonadota bacterium]|jgi:hypothetical protein